MFHYNLLSRTSLAGDIYGNTMETIRRRLTADEIRALNTTPIEIIPAPGAQNYIWIAKICAALEYSTAVFTGTGDLIFHETDNVGTEVAAELPYATLNSAVDILVDIDNANGTRVLNQGISISVETADPGGATAASILTLTVLYFNLKVY